MVGAQLIASCKWRAHAIIDQLQNASRKPKKSSDGRSDCPINLSIEVIGDRWSLLVIRDMMFGNRRHFGELLAGSEEGIASNILADRLRRLTEQGLVSRSPDPSHKLTTTEKRARSFLAAMHKEAGREAPLLTCASDLASRLARVATETRWLLDAEDAEGVDLLAALREARRPYEEERRRQEARRREEEAERPQPHSKQDSRRARSGTS